MEKLIIIECLSFASQSVLLASQRNTCHARCFISPILWVLMDNPSVHLPEEKMWGKEQKQNLNSVFKLKPITASVGVFKPWILGLSGEVM